jgi:hypothetical protein
MQRHPQTPCIEIDLSLPGTSCHLVLPDSPLAATTHMAACPLNKPGRVIEAGTCPELIQLTGCELVRSAKVDAA